jgi:hypothetical protein
MEPRLLRLLGQFQLLEFCLKLYIHFSHEIVRLKLDGALPFNYSFSQFDSHPLEKLLATFKQLNNNSKLQSRLHKLPKKRNDIAHKALLYQNEALSFLVTDLYDLDHVELYRDLGRTEEEVEDCMELLALELATVKSVYSSLRA